ncbi:hypothetical protein JCM19037_4565 [Geomicrobium sp. JCM 19037]|nr:hypothetical protein JCM19037_4565 [Geomicrobium sp. JCM 19037]
MEWARITKAKSIQVKIAETIGKSASAISLGVGAQPIPLADLPVITSIQLSMVASIAYISGRKLNRKTLVEFLGAVGANVGTAFAFRQLSRSLSKLVFPVAGHAVSGTLAATATWDYVKLPSSTSLKGNRPKKQRKCMKKTLNIHWISYERSAAAHAIRRPDL